MEAKKTDFLLQKTEWSIGASATLPNHSINPLNLGVTFSGPAASSFAPVPAEPGHPAASPGGWSVVAVITGYLPWQAPSTPIRKADALQTREGKNLVDWAEKKIPFAKAGFDVGVGTVIEGVTGTKIPKIHGTTGR